MKLWLVGSLAFISLAVVAPGSQAEPTRTCQFDPDLGEPNPLGMRSYISITEEDGNTTFLFEQFPSPVGDDNPIPVTIASNRMLTFYGTDIDEARRLMLNHPIYYSELVGYADPEGFGRVNAVLTCLP